MIRIILCGINGNMGTILLNRCYLEPGIHVVAGIGREAGTIAGIPIFSSLAKCTVEADVLIDFSDPTLTSEIVAYCRKKKTPLVMCTTGHSKEALNRLRRLSESVPVFVSANMSMGIALLMLLVQKAAIVLQESFDIEIIERHHRQKLDAPSGTALMLAEQINAVSAGKYDYVYSRNDMRKKRTNAEIGMHTIRGGSIVGVHEVMFAGDDEQISIVHRAESRSIYAIGALRAAQFIIKQRPGFYAMDSLLRGLLGS